MFGIAYQIVKHNIRATINPITNDSLLFFLWMPSIRLLNVGTLAAESVRNSCCRVTATHLTDPTDFQKPHLIYHVENSEMIEFQMLRCISISFEKESIM
jgi:hypothetical protein